MPIGLVYFLTPYYAEFSDEDFLRHIINGDLMEIWIGAFGYGFDSEKAIGFKGPDNDVKWGIGNQWRFDPPEYYRRHGLPQPEIIKHQIGLRGKVNKIIAEIFQEREEGTTYDEYGHKISNAYSEMRLVGLVTLTKGDADKFNWNHPGIKTGHWFRQGKYQQALVDSVRNSASLTVTSGEWLRQ